MKPVQQWQYRLNPNYSVKVKEEIDKLLQVGFIGPVKKATWLSPIVLVPKKNGKIRVCVDYQKLNAAMVTDAFSLPSTYGVLDAVAGHVAITKSVCTPMIRKRQHLSLNEEYL